MKKFLVRAVTMVTVLVISASVALAELPSGPLNQGPVAEIQSPMSNSQLRGRVQIKGSAVHPQFDFYKVEFGQGDNPPDDKMSIIGAIHKEQITNNLLETWDTTQIPDGTYTLRLRVVDKTGNYKEAWVRRLSVVNAAPTETPTPSEPTPTDTPEVPTPTETFIPPTPTIVVEQPFLQSATPQPTPTVVVVDTVLASAPSPTSEVVAMVATEPPVVSAKATPVAGAARSEGVSALAFSADLVEPGKLTRAMCYGAVFMAGVFLFFGLLSGVRRVILYLMHHE